MPRLRLLAVFAVLLVGCGDDSAGTGGTSGTGGSGGIGGSGGTGGAIDAPMIDAPMPDAEIDADPCGICLAVASCAVGGSSVTCTCPNGYAGDGTIAGTGCADIDECTTGANDCGPDLCSNTPGSFDCYALLGGDSSSGQVFRIDTATYAIASATVPADATAPQGIMALANHPTNGTIYGVLRTGRPGPRTLSTLNLTTYSWTDVGALGTAITSLAFDATGTLYGTSGRGTGVTPAKTLFTINPANATTTMVVALPDGRDGMTIAFHPGDGLLYHWSGYNTSTQIMETVDVSTATPTITTITETGRVQDEEVFGAVWSPPLGKFITTNILNSAVLVDTAGNHTMGGPTEFTGTTTSFDVRGLAWTVSAPRHKLAPASGTAAGGNTVTIFGLGIGDVPTPTVNFGAAPATNVTRVDASRLTVTVPAGTAAQTAVQVLEGTTLRGVYSYTYQ